MVVDLGVCWGGLKEWVEKLGREVSGIGGEGKVEGVMGGRERGEVMEDVDGEGEEGVGGGEGVGG
ncbi:hypothetical protein, partial [Kocuria salsicia]|uniref:hypothetical protein n=1 Tax=Kocuria salsicia TaxID=664639 RepID=UPI001C92DAF7